MKRKSKDEMFIQSFAEIYLLFCEYVENPGKRGYMAVLRKMKPESKELISSGLLDKKIEIEGTLREAEKEMKEIIGYWDSSDGLN